MKLLNFNIIKLTLCLIIGIVIGYYFEISFALSLQLLILFSVGSGICCLVFSSRSRFIYLFSYFALLTFVSLGIFTTKIHDETLQNSHYSNTVLKYSDYQNFTFKITNRLKPDDYNFKYFVEITEINGKASTGKLLLNLQKDSLKTDLKVGHYYFTNTKITEVVKPKNPFQFNYNQYLKKRHVHHQTYLSNIELLSLNSIDKSVYFYADTFRNTVNEELKTAGFKDDALSIINALLLGQRQDISPEIYNNYVNAGVIHILAVSGLHVGIIFWILSFILKPLQRVKYGKHVITPLLIIALLWMFAFVAGLSPSVTRAVTMFSIVAAADFLNRSKNMLNTLVISAFVMLLFKPIYLFDVGFQMSYLAVFAIVTIQPMLQKLWSINNMVGNYFWQIFTVTIAAQIGVAPISLFYFHQFPGLFFVSNLVIIPSLFIILSLGVLVIILALTNGLPSFLVKIFSFIIDSLNAFIKWIATFEDFLFRDLSFSIYHVVASYTIIISCIYLWKRKSIKALNLALVSVLLFSGVIIYTKHQTSKNELVIFNKNRATVIGEKHTHNLRVHHNLNSQKFKADKTLKNYKIGNFIKTESTDSVRSVYSYDSNLLLVVDSLGVYNTHKFKPSHILLTNSPKINLNRLIDSIKPKVIIADASNYKSYVERWKATCANKKILFHSTYEKGSYILK